MTKTTVNISEKLIYSILIGFSLSIATVFFGHMSPKNWQGMPAETKNYGAGYFSTYSANARVLFCSYECLFGMRHQSNCSDVTISTMHDKNLSYSEMFSDSFDHSSMIFIIGLIASIVIYLIQTVKIKVTN